MYKHVKIVNSLFPPNLLGYFQLLSDASQRETRQSSTYALSVSKSKLEWTKQSIFYCGALVWNTLPAYVQMTPTLKCFEELLDEYFSQ